MKNFFDSFRDMFTAKSNTTEEDLFPVSENESDIDLPEDMLIDGNILLGRNNNAMIK